MVVKKSLYNVDFVCARCHVSGVDVWRALAAGHVFARWSRVSAGDAVHVSRRNGEGYQSQHDASVSRLDGQIC